MSSNKFIGIVIVAYNRDRSLKRLLKSISEASYESMEVDLIISIDKGNNDEIIRIANEFNWMFGKKRIIQHHENLGLKDHILYCGSLTKEYENLVILEDDLYVSKNYFKYAVEASIFFKNDDNIAGISLYNIEMNQTNMLPFQPEGSCSDSYFIQYAQSWGQVWNRKKWDEFSTWYYKNKDTIDFCDKKIPTNIQNWSEKSWLKYHIYYCIKNNKFFSYPYYSLTTNFSETGTHNIVTSPAYQVNLDTRTEYKYRFIQFEDENAVIYDAFLERVDTKGKICFDIYGSKKEYGKYHLLLSSNKDLKFKIIKKYDLALRPQELNYFYNIPGSEIFLYDLNIESKNKISNSKSKQYEYYFRILEKRKILKILLSLISNKLR